MISAHLAEDKIIIEEIIKRFFLQHWLLLSFQLFPYSEILLELNKDIIGRKKIVFLTQGKRTIPSQKIISNICPLLGFVSVDKSLNF